MNDPRRNDKTPSEKHLWDLLSKDARSYPLGDYPWFAARTAARALQAPQKSSGFFAGFFGRYFPGLSPHIGRWMPLPMIRVTLAGIPLATVAAIAFLFLQHGSLRPNMLTHTGSVASSSSEAEFEEHIEMIAYSDYSQ